MRWLFPYTNKIHWKHWNIYNAIIFLPETASHGKYISTVHLGEISYSLLPFNFFVHHKKIIEFFDELDGIEFLTFFGKIFKKKWWRHHALYSTPSTKRPIMYVWSPLPSNRSIMVRYRFLSPLWSIAVHCGPLRYLVRVSNPQPPTPHPQPRNVFGFFFLYICTNQEKIKFWKKSEKKVKKSAPPLSWIF